ncbi:unnamed protein product [Nezara viridula]|uniref:Uncharacterized protein n=1 Tax=Nezara viridula TaxID=85310 RepID=A0A9P0H4Q1_NEZVI|nr:unnamed protein product [Nezara viridula]
MSYLQVGSSIPKRNQGLSSGVKKRNRPLCSFADVSSIAVDRKSYKGYCFKYAVMTISWESRKQRTVALSTQEAECKAFTDVAKEFTHLEQLLTDMVAPHEAIIIFNDNTSKPH